MDISSIGAVATFTKAAQRDQDLSIAAVKQQNAADRGIVAMLGDSLANVSPSADPARGQRLDITV